MWLGDILLLSNIWHRHLGSYRFGGNSSSLSHSLSLNVVFVFYFLSLSRKGSRWAYKAIQRWGVLFEKGKHNMCFVYACMYVYAYAYITLKVSHIAINLNIIIIIIYITPFETQFVKITFSFIHDVSQYKSIHINNRHFQS